MIVVKEPSWIRMVFAVRGCSLKDTLPRIAVVTFFSILVAFIAEHKDAKNYLPTLTTTPFSLIGLALAIFLGFRNNESYHRFWEGRILWGRLVNVSRSFSRQVLTLIDSNDPAEQQALAELRRDLIHRMIGYVHCFRHHLRGTEPWTDVVNTIPQEECDKLAAFDNRPTAVVQSIGDRLNEAQKNGWLSEFHVPVLENSLTEITAIQGGCERIKATPIPFTYNVLIHRIVAIYCFMLPLGLVSEINFMMPVVVAFVSYAFLGLDHIGDELEQPFGTEVNHLPLSGMCTNIEINLRQALGEEHVPSQLEPKDGVLS